jgi:DNA-binding CsgD family transcriptional regulator
MPDNLTEAQKAILSDLSAGLETKEIALRRHIQPRTIYQHLSDARGRLGAFTRDHAIAMYVTRYGMAEDEKVVA